MTPQELVNDLRQLAQDAADTARILRETTHNPDHGVNSNVADKLEAGIAVIDAISAAIQQKAAAVEEAAGAGTPQQTNVPHDPGAAIPASA